ncbi:MAG TPA: response regulator, partial [Gemmatimonadales bacterium]|nr:response regulator [Gemmatimonadales bacterium]
IRDKDRVTAILNVTAPRSEPLTPQDLQALRVISGILSAGFTNHSAFEANARLLGEVRAGRDAAEAANRSKSAFLATMSHELRTPLNSVIGFANILLRNKEQHFGEKDLQFLARIKENGTQLLHLINDVLDVSKIEAGRMEVRPVPTDLAPLIQEAVAQLEPQARERGVELEVQVPPHLGPAEIDPTRFRQVLLNLVGNALKFTEQGSIRVVVSGDTAGRPVRVDVIDTGIGIPPDRLAAIFEAFTQAESTTERRYGGTGLGLTISRALLKLMGADLTVTSTVGVGSTFSVLLPVPAVPTTPAQVTEALEARAPVPAPGGPKPLVLVVDDERDSRALLRTYLEEDGYRTAEASDGAEGLALARELHPALITLDVRMPNVDGLSMLRQLRQDPELAAIPVVVVSIEAAEHRGALIGAVDTLAKPVDREALLAVIDRARPAGRRRVLVIDDDAHTRQLYAALLGAEGYQVISAGDGLGALTAMQADPPDLVLLDLMMPVMDGGSFLAALRNDARFRGIPVAVLTALDTDSEAVRRLSGMAQAVIQKGPALEQSLRRLIERLIGPARG